MLIPGPPSLPSIPFRSSHILFSVLRVPFLSSLVPLSLLRVAFRSSRCPPALPAFWRLSVPSPRPLTSPHSLLVVSQTSPLLLGVPLFPHNPSLSLLGPSLHPNFPLGVPLPTDGRRSGGQEGSGCIPGEGGEETFPLPGTGPGTGPGAQGLPPGQGAEAPPIPGAPEEPLPIPVPLQVHREVRQPRGLGRALMDLSVGKKKL